MDELAQVAVDVTAEGTDRLYTYTVPPQLKGRLVPGQWVRVPFGPQGLVGLYVGPAEAAPEGVTLRAIRDLLPEIPPIPQNLVALARWTADRYLSTFAAALRLLLPAEARRQAVRSLTITRYRLLLDQQAAQEIAAGIRGRAPRQAVLLEELLARGGTATLPELVAAAGEGIRPPIRAALERGWITAAEQVTRRDPFAGEAVRPAAPPVLTPQQRAALEAIGQELAAPGALRRPVLLHGVTGSGKTEVYLRAIAQVAEQGRQAICLVPEIALTPQIIQRFRGRFGAAVAVLHSALSAGERFDEWQRISRGEVAIVVGARSAIFAPFAAVGLIIIDEEQENSYKQESPAPCYHARDVAEQRARLEGALLVLGSATPALESYHRAQTGGYRLVRLADRVDSRPMPPVRLVDMREELRAGNRSIFSRALQDALQQTLAAREQAILFLNRRGYNTFILCRSCGEAVTCPNCAVALTYHMGANHLSCHYCEHRTRLPKLCPACQSPQIRHMGAGTERVEEELRKLFPQARIARMDVDTTRRKGAHAALIRAVENRELDLLVGTQMIAKGLDFPEVTLVGVVLADTALNLPDFRAAERAFQLVTQVAGRAGRAQKAGHVLVQTYQPEHYSLQAAQHHGYQTFYDREIAFRQEMRYPPFSHLIHLLLSGPEEEKVQQTAEVVGRLLTAGEPGARFDGDLLGPAPAPLARLKGQFRYHLLLKGSDPAVMARQVRLAFARAGSGWRKGKDVRLSVDVAPVSIL